MPPRKRLDFDLPPPAPKMSVTLTPSTTLGFPRPLTQLVKRSLSITNENDRPVAFKVKTTAPKLYCVRPNSGRVEPGETVEVSVMLQAMKEEPPLNAKCKDKFLIQSTLITPEKDGKQLAEIWNVSDAATGPDRVFQQKLKVQYLRSEHAGVLEEEDEHAANQSSILHEQTYDTVRQHPATNGHPSLPISAFNRAYEPEHEREASPPVADFSVADEVPIPIHNDSRIETEPPAPEPLPSFAVAPAPAPPRVPTPVVHVQQHTEPAPVPAPVKERRRSHSPAPASEKLLAKLQEYEAENERLRALLAEAIPPPSTEAPSEMRRRRSRRYSDNETVLSGVSDARSYVEEMPQQEGVSLQVVVVVALTVFITTYLFF
ncbi:VAMP-associated protein [Cylindrobasidium torrendii FP15055 ss-10]|uniref:VAMP-associated protein n=1 Tax=Cylindrobasidium torrendii FP15055 ss-10 TaxID=1314674 RepID=A0A0D7BQG6_9AGAR|nr:VAMP-associated protein [Cylindrobasidium torrendii FP15055 ss-10]